MSTALGVTIVKKARKEHTCTWCGEKILPSETYQKWAWADEGQLSSVKVHPECSEAWQTLDYPEDEIIPHEFSRGCTCEHNNCQCKEKHSG